MFLSVLISALFGEKVLNKFLLLVLVSQLVINSDKAVKLIEKVKLTNEKVNDNNNNTDNKFSGDVINGTLVSNFPKLESYLNKVNNTKNTVIVNEYNNIISPSFTKNNFTDDSTIETMFPKLKN